MASQVGGQLPTVRNMAGPCIKVLWYFQYTVIIKDEKFLTQQCDVVGARTGAGLNDATDPVEMKIVGDLSKSLFLSLLLMDDIYIKEFSYISSINTIQGCNIFKESTLAMTKPRGNLSLYRG